MYKECVFKKNNKVYQFENENVHMKIQIVNWLFRTSAVRSSVDVLRPIRLLGSEHFNAVATAHTSCHLRGNTVVRGHSPSFTCLQFDRDLLHTGAKRLQAHRFWLKRLDAALRPRRFPQLHLSAVSLLLITVLWAPQLEQEVDGGESLGQRMCDTSSSEHAPVAT